MFSRAGPVCKKAVKKWLERQLLAYSLNEELLYDPLLAFQHIRVAVTNLPSLDESKELEYPICYDCRSQLMSALYACQQYIWDMIPHFFGIEALVEDKDYGYAQYL